MHLARTLLTLVFLATLLITPLTDSAPYGGGNAIQQGGCPNIPLLVRTRNHSPSITSTPVTGALIEAVYHYGVTATDSDADPLSFSLTTAPSGMVIDSFSGMIAWLPATYQVGNHDVTVQVTDGKGGSDTQSFVKRVPRKCYA